MSISINYVNAELGNVRPIGDTGRYSDSFRLNFIEICVLACSTRKLHSLELPKTEDREFKLGILRRLFCKSCMEIIFT